MISRADVLAAARATGAGYDVQPVRGVQARMAEKMALSHSEIPPAKVSVDVVCTALLRLRDRFRSAYRDITPFVLTLRLLVIALAHNTILNSIGACTWGSGWLRHARERITFLAAASCSGQAGRELR